MRNTILLITLALFFSFNLSGCSLFSGGDDEGETATVAEESADSGDDEFASDDFESGSDKESDDGDSSSEEQVASNDDDDWEDDDFADSDDSDEPSELAAQDVEVEDDFGDEELDDYPDDDYSKGTTTAAAVSDDFIDDNDFASEDSVSVDEGGGIPDVAMSQNQEEDLFGGDTEPVVDTPAYSGTGFSSDDYMDPVTDVPKFVPVKKMKPAAYNRAGSNINRLYVVRSGDNMASIANKIYGSDRSDDLYKWNSHFQGKSINVGDKIYYSSPNNPNDSTMMTYYEDVGMSPQYYTSQGGDNIRKISKNLLGHSRSWMEVYATNENVDSKGRLPAGLQIRYWPDGAAPQQTMAQNDSIPEPEPAPMPDPEPVAEPQEVAMEEPDMMEPEAAAEPEEVNLDEPTEVAQLDDPQPFEDGKDEPDFTPPPAAGSVAPPPPPQPVAPPPPPSPAKPMADFKKPAPPKMPVAGGGDNPLAAMGDDSTIMAALGGLLILAAIIMLIFIRRSRSKRVNFSQTQV